jgi:hypothetical protein
MMHCCKATAKPLTEPRLVFTVKSFLEYFLYSGYMFCIASLRQRPLFPPQPPISHYQGIFYENFWLVLEGYDDLLHSRLQYTSSIIVLYLLFWKYEPFSNSYTVIVVTSIWIGVIENEQHSQRGICIRQPVKCLTRWPSIPNCNPDVKDPSRRYPLGVVSTAAPCTCCWSLSAPSPLTLDSYVVTAS